MTNENESAQGHAHCIFIPVLITLLPALAGFASWAYGQEPGTLRDIENVRNELQQLKEKLEGELGPVKTGDKRFDEMFGDILGFEKAQKALDEAEQAALKVKVTEDDVEGLDAYCGGKFADATACFRKSLDVSPNRPFPYYYIAACAFEQGDYVAAKEAFAKVVALDATVNSARVLGCLSELCEGKKDIPSADLLLLVGQACRETEEKLPKAKDEGISFAAIFLPKLACDPISYKSDDVMRRIRLRRVGRFAADLTATKDPDKKMALTLAFADKYFLAPLAEKLAADHPERKDLRVYAFLAKYFCAAKEDFPTDEGFPGALDVALKAEPGNAALLLFRVPYRKPTMSREGEPPMTEEELRPFREACHATGFNTYRWWKLEEAYRVMFRSLGGWTSINVGPHTPSITGYHLNVMRRVQSTFSAYAAEGKTDDAVKLLEDCRALVALMNRESPVMLSNIIADFYPISVYPKVLQSIAQSGRKDLIDATIGAIEAAHRRAYQRMLLYNEVSENVVVLLPVRRLKEAALDIELGTGVVERVVGSLMARRKEQMVKAALDDIESQLRWGGDPQRVNVESIIQLGDLKDAKAVPTLEKLAEFKDITTRLLAERALARIAKTETP